MVTDTEKRIAKVLAEKKVDMLASPSLSLRYEEMLLEAFPTERPNIEFFHPNTFDGSDEIDYLACRNIFDNKNWNEVSFNSLYDNYVQFLMLNTDGRIYYLPAFLKNFYDLKHLQLEFFSSFLHDLMRGFTLPPSDVLHKSIEDNTWHQIPPDYLSFERINPIQSKLVAVFLVNVANLLPSDWYDARLAQRALTNYWGNFLLF